MNILIPHSWLLEHLDTAAKPEEIQRMLSLCGPSVERINDVDGEPVYDIEITTNRADSFSVRGIAREAAVILPQFGIGAKLKPIRADVIKSEGKALPLPKIDNDPSLNRRVLMVLLDGVKHAPTPDWMARRLLQIGQNVHDSVIDITNYITHELGHPCHAFDYDKIMSLGGEIIVKKAAAGTAFTTLDGESYTAAGGEVVLVNPSGEIIDLPGIKGTANSAVDDHTTKVLLFIESIQPEKIRYASMTHAIRTVAAQINEKNIDPGLADDVLRRGVELYRELTGARAASPVFDEFPGMLEPRPIVLPLSRVEDYLGLALPAEAIGRILSDLGCKVAGNAKVLEVIPPSYRPDLSIPVDLIEEVARIYGYHNLPSVLLDTPIPTDYPEGINFPLEERTQQLLADLGYQELFTYSLVSEALARRADADLEHTLKLRNPLTSDQEYLRRAILPSHVEALAKQLPRSAVKGSFELANVYHPEGQGLPDEHLVLAILDRDLRSLRQSVETLLGRLYITDVRIDLAEDKTKKDGQIAPFYQSAAVITHHKQVLGSIGYLDNGLVGAELIWRELLALAKRTPRYQGIPGTAPYIEDLTLEIAAGIPVGAVQDSILGASEVIRRSTLLDRYQNRWTFRLQYWDYRRQLDADEAKKLRDRALAALAKLGVRLAE
jgi:phenylalanyl-tRNA synthetase beta chain